MCSKSVHDKVCLWQIKLHYPKASHKIKTPVTAATVPKFFRDSVDIIINFATIFFNSSGNRDKRIPSTANIKPIAVQTMVAISITSTSCIKEKDYFLLVPKNLKNSESGLSTIVVPSLKASP